MTGKSSLVMTTPSCGSPAPAQFFCAAPADTRLCRSSYPFPVPSRSWPSDPTSRTPLPWFMVPAPSSASTSGIWRIWRHWNISEQALARFRQLFRIEPAIAVRDLHPGYLSTRIAEELGLERDHSRSSTIMPTSRPCWPSTDSPAPALGIAFDGTGYGDDGNVWGARSSSAIWTGYRRMAHLRYVPSSRR